MIYHLAYDRSVKVKVLSLFDSSQLLVNDSNIPTNNVVINSPYYSPDWNKIFKDDDHPPAPRSGNNGLDTYGPSNSPIYSMIDGVVIHTSNSDLNTYNRDDSGNPGTSVTIRSTLLISGKSTVLEVTYSHLVGSGQYTNRGDQGGCKVLSGERVSAGTLIGYQGNTGNSSKEHLHISVKVNSHYCDPYPLVVGTLTNTVFQEETTSKYTSYSSTSSSGSNYTPVSSMDQISVGFTEYESLSSVAKSNFTTSEAIVRANNLPSTFSLRRNKFNSR